MIIAIIKRFLMGGSEPRQASYSGGVLPSVMLLLFLFFLVFTYELSSYRQEMRLYNQTKAHYQVKTLERLTLGRLQNRVADELLEGEDQYTVGKVSYVIKETVIELVVTLDSGFRYEAIVKRDK